MEHSSRSRVVDSINHREPDRVPIDVTMELDAYLALKAFLRLDIDEVVRPSNMMEVSIHPEVLHALGADIIPVKLSRPRNWRPKALDGGKTIDEWGVVRARVEPAGGGAYMEVVHSPLQQATLADLRTYPWPDPADPGRIDGLAERAEALFNGTDLALMGRFGGSLLGTSTYLLGWETLLVRMVEDSVFVGELLDRIADIQMALDEAGLQAAGSYLQIFKVSGEDLGMQTSPLVSRRTFLEVIKPRLCRRWRAVRRVLERVNPGCKIMLHTCGSVRAFIPDFIECGIDILDPVQPRAAGMNSRELKQEFGGHLTFHGGVDVQHVLPAGSHDEVVAEVKQRILDYAPGGGYILAPAHNVQADVPPENLVLMCRTAQEFGCYPIRPG